MASNSIEIPQASLLGIPPELRCRIYEFAIGIDTGKHQLCLTGKAKGTSQRTANVMAALPLVSRAIRSEILPMLPAISDIFFIFQDFTTLDILDWLDAMGRDRLCQIRKWEFHGWAKCGGINSSWFAKIRNCDVHKDKECDEHCEKTVDPVRAMEKQGFCHRFFTIDLHRSETAMCVAHTDQSRHENLHNLRESLPKEPYYQFWDFGDLIYLIEGACFQGRLSRFHGAIEKLAPRIGSPHVTKSDFSDIFAVIMADRTGANDGGEIGDGDFDFDGESSDDHEYEGSDEGDGDSTCVEIGRGTRKWTRRFGDANY